jgi:hypothetical protein
VKQVQASRRPSPPQKEEPRDLSRHFRDLSRPFGIDRYTFRIEIAASPTKQTADTHVNRYKNRLCKSRFFRRSRVTNHESFPRLRNTDSNNGSAIRNRRK